MANLKKIMVAIHTINMEKNNHNWVKNAFVKKIIDDSLYKKNLILYHLVEKGHATSFEKSVVASLAGFNTYNLVSEVSFWRYKFHFNYRKVMLNKKPPLMRRQDGNNPKTKMEFMTAMNYLETFILRHKIY